MGRGSDVVSLRVSTLGPSALCLWPAASMSHLGHETPIRCRRRDHVAPGRTLTRPSVAIRCQRVTDGEVGTQRALGEPGEDGRAGQRAVVSHGGEDVIRTHR